MENNREHYHSAEWIKREEQKYADTECQPWYERKPETVIHNKDNTTTIMWGMPVNTDRNITANRPDIIVKDSVNSTCKLIDMTIPSDGNIALKEIERKKSKYKDLELEIQRMWQMKNRSDLCGCWCAWHSKEGNGRKHQESIRESYCDRDPKDLHAGIYTIPRKVLTVQTERLTSVTDAPAAWFAHV